MVVGDVRVHIKTDIVGIRCIENDCLEILVVGAYSQFPTIRHARGIFNIKLMCKLVTKYHKS